MSQFKWGNYCMEKDSLFICTLVILDMQGLVNTFDSIQYSTKSYVMVNKKPISLLRNRFFIYQCLY